MDAKKDIMWRINVSFIVICLIGLLIIGQIIRIQFAQGDYWRAMADSLTLKYVDIEASRGNIFSSDGMLISTSIPIYDVHLDMDADGMTDEIFNASIDSLSYSLSDLFKDKTPQEYKNMLKEARLDKQRYFLLKKNIQYPELQKLKSFALLRLGRYKGGLLIDKKEKRELPFKLLASRTIGYLRDVKPVGIEASFNKNLQGESGQRLMQKIGGNVWMPVTDKDELEPRDGDDIITTIDINVQDVAETSLENHLRSHNADHGCAVLMEVETGQIKAIANLSKTADGTYTENFNYVVGEATEPGSTMKLASLLAALDDGLIEPTDTVNVGNGTCTYYGQKMEDSHPPHSSRLTVQRAFETSSNVGISRVIYQSYSKRPQAFVDKLHSFGLGQKLGLQIEGEGSPAVKNTKDRTWSQVSLPWMSIGYEVALTPLQILTFYNAVANNGRMVRPHFVKEIRNHGRLVKSFGTEIIRDSIASLEAIAKAKKMLEGVVDSGTASTLNSSPYRIAGKTGTAQMFNKYGYDKNHRSYQASFVGYFPASAPKYTCMVVVYAPSNEMYYGGAVAAPIFKEIADKVYSTHFELHEKSNDTTGVKAPSLPLAKAGYTKDTKKVLTALKVPVNSVEEDGSVVSVKSTDSTMVLIKREVKMGLVPNVVGMGIRDALYLLESSGLRVIVNGRGNILRQSVDPGKKIVKGQSIILELGT